MNTNNDNLQTNITSQLSNLSTQHDQLNAALITAQSSLYYAQGAELAARDKFAETQEQITFCGHMNDQCQFNDSQVQNLLATATIVKNVVGGSLTNVATAAANVSRASNAIEKLAADMGAALSIAQSSLGGTDSFKKIEQATNLINEVAKQSCEISLLALATSSKSSEIMASNVANQTGAVKTGIDSLLANTQTAFGAASQAIIQDSKNISAASIAQRQAQGTKRDAKRQFDALKHAFRNTNNQLNQGLEVTVISGGEIAVSFRDLFSKLPKGFVGHVDPKPTYYVTLVALSDATGFSNDVAYQQYIQRPKDDNSRFHKVEPKVKDVRKDLNLIHLTKDAYDKDISAGTAYVAFLYIELSIEYKQYMGSFVDLLSAPSLAFIPATNLPRALVLGTEEAKKVEKNPMGIYFKADVPKDLLENFEFRCILVECTRDPDLNFWYSGTNKELPIFFNLNIAQLVTPSNYIKAKLVSNDHVAESVSDEVIVPPAVGANSTAPLAASNDVKAASVSKVSQKSDTLKTFVARLSATTTDNFGNRCKKGRRYQPIILAIATGDASQKYISTLSTDLKVWEHTTEQHKI